jgi:hypothetical protein
MAFYASSLGRFAACAVDEAELALAGCRRLRRLNAGPKANFDRTCLEGSSLVELCYDGVLEEAQMIFGEILAGLKREVHVRARDGVRVQKARAEVNGIHTLSSLAEAPVLAMDARVIILSDVDDLSERGLSGSRSLASVILSTRVVALPEGFFADCFRLKSVNIAECRALVQIGDACFSRCASLCNLSFPSSLEIIGPFALYESALNRVVLDDTRVLEGCDLSGCVWMRELRIPVRYRDVCGVWGSGRIATVTAAVMPEGLPLVESFRCSGMCFPFGLRDHTCCRRCFAFGEVASLACRACRPFLPC